MTTPLLDNGTFCVLPFINRLFDKNGQNYFCCFRDIESPIDYSDKDTVIELKKKILNGEKISHCKKCYKDEEQGLSSPRITNTIQWLRKEPTLVEYLESWNENSVDKILSYDLLHDNKCNLACIGCGPYASTLWAKELKIETFPHKPDYNYEDLLTSKKIYLAGGEPLIIDEYLKLINDISKLDIQPELVINTNLTRTNDELKESLSKIKNLSLTISVDGFESVNEYHRWPMTWNKFIENLMWARSINCNIMFNTVVDAISILNIDQLTQIEHLTDNWNLSILNFPDTLLIENLPEKFKQHAYDNFINIKKSKFYGTDANFRNKVDHILDRIMQPGNVEILQKKIKSLDDSRNINHSDYLGINLLDP